MPSWKAHLIFNTLPIVFWVYFFLNYSFVSDIPLLIFMTFISYFLSIFPDIDSSKSEIRNFFAILIALIVLIYLVFNSIINSVKFLFLGFIFFYILFRFLPTKHRGLTHNFWFSVIVSLSVTIVFWAIFGLSSEISIIYFFFILSGYFSHIILDKIS